MDTMTIITFDPDERDVFRLANLHLTLAYPDAGKEAQRGSKETSPDLLARVVYRLGIDQMTGTLANLERALDVYRTLLRKCEEDAEYWASERDRVQALIASGEAKPSADGVSLIADPAGAANLLAETRVSQARDVRPALALIEQALRMIPQRELLAVVADAAEAGL